jgi:hypothetical protein
MPREEPVTMATLFLSVFMVVCGLVLFFVFGSRLFIAVTKVLHPRPEVTSSMRQTPCNLRQISNFKDSVSSFFRTSKAFWMAFGRLLGERSDRKEDPAYATFLFRCSPTPKRRWPILRRIPARVVGVGFRPEHVKDR